MGNHTFSDWGIATFNPEVLTIKDRDNHNQQDLRLWRANTARHPAIGSTWKNQSDRLQQQVRWHALSIGAPWVKARSITSKQHCACTAITVAAWRDLDIPEAKASYIHNRSANSHQGRDPSQTNFNRAQTKTAQEVHD